MGKNSYILFIMMILFTSSFVPYSFASIESEALEDVLAGCRDGQTLVYRAAYLDYVCVDPPTAERWVELGLAEIAQEAVISDTTETIETPETSEESEFPGAPPPAPKQTERDTSDDSECREGNILIYRFAYQDTICTSPSTASTWERLGISEIVKKSPSAQNEILIDSPPDDLVTIPDISDIEESQTIVEEESQTIVEEESQTIVEEESQTIVEEESQTIVEEESQTIVEEESQTIVEEESQTIVEEESQIAKDVPSIFIDSDIYPMIREVEEDIFNLIDQDGSSSFMIIGDEGLIAIDTLSSYESTKKIMANFDSAPDKKIKAVILTNINPDILFALEAYSERSDGTLEIVISEDLLDDFQFTYDTKVEHSVPFSDSLFIDVAGLELEVFEIENHESFQTLIYLEDYEGMIIGNSDYGIYPFFIDIESLSNFLNE